MTFGKRKKKPPKRTIDRHKSPKSFLKWATQSRGIRRVIEGKPRN